MSSVYPVKPELRSYVMWSVFDGCGMGPQAAKEADYILKEVHTFEVDPYAMKISKKNHPESIQHGCVTNCTYERMKDSPPDVIIGGSPCQGFSSAGFQRGLEDSRSRLFWEWIRIRDLALELNPDCVFILENVKMKKEWVDKLSDAVGVRPIIINSSLMTAQNRVRLYWTNIPNVQQPNDHEVKLKDILEVGGFVTDREKSYCIDANYFKGGNVKNYLQKHRRQIVFSPQGLAHVANADLKGNESIQRVYHEDGKAPTMTTCGGGHREPKVLVHPASIVGRRLNDRGVREDYNKAVPLTQCLQVKHNPDKSGCLTTVEKDNVVSLNPPGRYPNAYEDEQLMWRKLTPLECERLQGVPDGYTEGVSNTQRYKMLGNGFTIPVISHILSHALEENLHG
jgi:DNA-cytosine methyltransferase